jgi:CheY-like chemotaxis protein
VSKVSKVPRIFLIDDDIDFLEVNACILEQQGYCVVSFSNPQRALAQVIQEPPDLVVTDLMMSAFDSGFSVAKHIKEDPRVAHIPVMIVTAVSSQLGFNFAPRNPEELKAMHADAFMSKPLSPKTFVEKIEELLELAGKEVQHE